ncbi:MAG: RsiV family protein [Pseudomonadota bacterium]
MRALIAVLAVLALPASAEVLNLSKGGTSATITLADEAASFPALAAFLRTDAEAVVSDYADEGAARVTVRDRATYRDDRFASILRRSEADIGGQTANVYTEGLVWDAAVEDFIRLGAFFDEGEPRDEALTALSVHVREAIRTRVWGGKVSSQYVPLVDQATSPDLAVMSNFTILPGGGGVLFHYSPYEVAPQNKGAVEIAAPTSVFAPWLNETGRRLFR